MRSLKLYIFIIPLLFFSDFNNEDAVLHIISDTVLTTTKATYPLRENYDVSMPFYALVTTYYNEQQYAWGFGLQNTTGDVVDAWQVRINSTNFQLDPTQLTNQAAFDYVQIINGNGTFDLVLTGTSSISGWGGIPGGNIAWNGVNFGFNPTSDGITIYTGTDVVIPGPPPSPSIGTVITNKRITYRVNN